MVLALIMLLVSLPSLAWATIYTNLDLENSTVNAAITNGSTHDGALIELFDGDAAYPTPYTRASISTPSGSRYHEVLTLCGGYSGGRCTPAGDPSVTTIQAGFVTNHSSINWTTQSGNTFYLGGFFRFDRVGGRNVWSSTDSFDKLWEFGGNGGAHSTRWGIGAGRHGNFSNWDSSDTFTFDIWCADSVFDACEVPASNDWDHKPHNTGGYTASNPYECSFERWYAVVIAVTMSTTSSGNVKLYINGTLVHDSNRITMDSGSSSSSNVLHGTIAQGDYDAPDHYRRSDKLMFTDSLTDITNAGLMEDPEAGGSPEAPPSLVMFIGQGFVAVMTAFQYLVIVSYLWERRTKAIHALLAIHQWYWTIRYRQAVKKWNAHAPLMIEHRGDVIDLRQEEQTWQLRK